MEQIEVLAEKAEVDALGPGYRQLYDEAGGALKREVLAAAAVDPDEGSVEDTRRCLDIYPERAAANSLHRDGRDAWSTAVGNIETASGQRYDFRSPDPDTVLLADIAHALSNVCRFAGHIRRFNSVAEHSVLVSRIVEARSADVYWSTVALLHDGHEAYIWDAPSPVKPLLGDVFRELGAIADKVIAEKFLPQVAPTGLIPRIEDFKDPRIKAADRNALMVEGRALLPVGPTDDEWEPLPPGVQWDGGLTPYEAKTLFLQRAKELGL
jgi:hypothetical protein